ARPPGIARRGRSVSRGGLEERASERLQARCKVNLGLAVLARRGDGYHQIETVMARLALADELEVALSEPPEGAEAVALEVVTDRDGREAGHLRATPAAATPQGADNLAVRAAEAYLAAWREVTGAASPGVRLRLTKRVPVAAGLGGGSADAG